MEENLNQKLKAVVDGINYEHHQRIIGIQRVVEMPELDLDRFPILSLLEIGKMTSYFYHNLPHVQGMGRGSGAYPGNELARRANSKHNPLHHSTYVRLKRRERRQAKAATR